MDRDKHEGKKTVKKNIRANIRSSQPNKPGFSCSNVG